MASNARIPRAQGRRIAHRTTGHRQGPITRLISPHDIGELVKPFVFLDYFAFPDAVKSGLPVHPHSGIATHTTLLQGSVDYAAIARTMTLKPGKPIDA
jgi:redox-sensitive bicupin YhaK (pirin superfamily)